MPRSRNADFIRIFSFCAALLLAGHVVLSAANAVAQQHLTGQRFIEPVDIAPLDTTLDSNWSAQGVGVLDPDKGGFGIDLWAGTKARLVARMFEAIPADGGSWVLHKTLETALLSTARPPAADDGNATKGMDFVAMRADLLQKMGLSGSSLRLLQAAGGSDQEQRAALLARAALANNNIKEACDWGGTWGNSSNNPDRPRDAKLAGFWTKVNILCAVATKQADKARFMTALAQEQGYTDSAFEQMVNAATLEPAPTTENTTENTPAPKAEKLVLNRPIQDMADMALARHIVAQSGQIEAPLPTDPALRAIVLADQIPATSGLDTRLRLRHSLDLARRGILDHDALRAILARIPAHADAGKTLGDLDKADYDAALDLLMASLAQDDHDAPEWPALWQATAHRLAPWRGAVLEQLSDWLDAISPANNLQTDLDEIAIVAALVRAAEGRDDDAARWLTIAGPDQAQKGRLMLVPFDWLAGRFQDIAANAWLEDMLRTPANNSPDAAYAELALNLAAATGGVDPTALQPLLSQLPAISEPAALDQNQALVMVALDQAATEGQKGMVLLLAQQAVGRQDISTLDNGRIVAIVRALHQVGFEDAARMLAREALIGRLMPSIAPPPPKDMPATPAKAKAKKAPTAKSSPQKP